jgi:hypothetical protein
MPGNKQESDRDRAERIVGEARRERRRREQGYREQALKLFPWVCARCGREFEGKKLRELTVHHKDHDHDNNPPDGSNWELLCLYCHENEHSRYLDQEYFDPETPGGVKKPAPLDKPFANLGDLLKNRK